MSHPIRNPVRPCRINALWLSSDAETHECDRDSSADIFGEISIIWHLSRISVHRTVVICKYGVSQRTLSVTVTSAITNRSSPVKIARCINRSPSPEGFSAL